MKDVYVILGSPGSSKTTLAVLLARSLGFHNISWGELVRSSNADTERKSLFARIIANKTDDKSRSLLISKIIENEISKASSEDSVSGLILDGFPRRKSEAAFLIKMLGKYNLNMRCIVNINESLLAITANMKNRSTCSFCGKTYNETLLPKNLGVCDFDGAKLIKGHWSSKEIKDEFIQFSGENSETYDFLKGYADLFFSVSGDEDALAVLSNTIYKLKRGFRENYQIFHRQSFANLPTKYGVFTIITYLSKVDYSFHVALVKGEVRGKTGVLTRVHSSCMTGDLFGSLKCDCGQQLHSAMGKINKLGCGVIIYLLQEGRGINIVNKIGTYSLQEAGFDTVEANEHLGLPAEMRQYSAVRDILNDLGVKSIRLLTNNPDKVSKLTDLGIVIEGVHRLESKPTAENITYLATKKSKMGHRLSYV